MSTELLDPFGISTAELARRSGATERQIRYWSSKGYLPGFTSSGSGFYLRWPEELIQPLSVAVARLKWGVAVGPALFRLEDPPLPSFDQVALPGVKVVSSGIDQHIDRSLLSVPDLQAYLGVSKPTVYSLISKGMPSIKIGRFRRFRLADVDAWLDQQAVSR